MKLGDHVAAQKSLQTALRAIEDALIYFLKAHRPDWFRENLKRVAQLLQVVFIELGKAYHLKMFCVRRSFETDVGATDSSR
jgi:hypothetical protein